MTRVTRTTSPRAAASAGVRLGERLRQLRVAAGLTQSELAGTRFSKEYVSQIARGEALTSANRDAEAVAEFENARTAVLATGLAELEVRALCGESWARMRQGEVREAIELLNRARSLAEGPEFSDIDRADVLYRLGVCRYQLTSIQTALGLFNEALSLANASSLPCDHLRASI